MQVNKFKSFELSDIGTTDNPYQKWIDYLDDKMQLIKDISHDIDISSHIHHCCYSKNDDGTLRPNYMDSNYENICMIKNLKDILGFRIQLHLAKRHRDDPSRIFRDGYIKFTNPLEGIMSTILEIRSFSSKNENRYVDWELVTSRHGYLTINIYVFPENSNVI